ncbi:hypothetical protein [Ancylobacter sp. FA202]|nr:hypothetical protein [Ancylobacter sp. FA202]
MPREDETLAPAEGVCDGATGSLVGKKVAAMRHDKVMRYDKVIQLPRAA